MVRVNQMESAESKSITNQKPESGAGAASEAMKLMDKPQLPSAIKRAEPDQLSFNASIYDCHRPGAKHVITPGERDFRPDPTLSSKGAREWQDKHREQSQKPMEVNKDGKYEVKPGDSFASIAKRDLKKDGKEPSQADIDKRSKELQDLNKDSTSNGHYLKPGMQLRMKPEEGECKRVPNPADKTEVKPGDKSEVKPGVKPENKTDGKTHNNTGGPSGNYIEGNGVGRGARPDWSGTAPMDCGKAPQSGAGNADGRQYEGIMNAPGYVRRADRGEQAPQIQGSESTQKPQEPRGFRTRPESGNGTLNVAPRGESYNLTDKPDGNIDRILAQPI